MSKWDDQSDVVEYFTEIIENDISRYGESGTLSEILSEYFDKDDIREIYSEEFKIIDAKKESKNE